MSVLLNCIGWHVNLSQGMWRSWLPSLFWYPSHHFWILCACYPRRLKYSNVPPNCKIYHEKLQTIQARKSSHWRKCAVRRKCGQHEGKCLQIQKTQWVLGCLRDASRNCTRIRLSYTADRIKTKFKSLRRPSLVKTRAISQAAWILLYIYCISVSNNSMQKWVNSSIFELSPSCIWNNCIIFSSFTGNLSRYTEPDWFHIIIRA